MLEAGVKNGAIQFGRKNNWSNGSANWSNWL